MSEDVAAQVGDDALAQGVDEIVPKCARDRQRRRDADHHQEIRIDQRNPARRKAEIDHTPRRDWHNQRRHCRQD